MISGRLFTYTDLVDRALGALSPIRNASSLGAALKQADLDYEVDKRPVFDYRQREIEGYYAIHRLPEDTVIGVVGQRYTPILNRVAFGPLDTWIGAGDVRIYRGGVFDNGRIAVLLASLNPSVLSDVLKNVSYLPDSVRRLHLAFLNSFDGSYQVSFFPFMMAGAILPLSTVTRQYTEQSEERIAVRHVSSGHIRLQLASFYPKVIARNVGPSLVALDKMARTKVSENQIEKLLKECLYSASQDNLEHDTARRREERLLKIVTEVKAAAVFHPDCEERPDLANTMLGFLLGFSTWVDFERKHQSKDAARRLYSNLLGGGSDLKRRMFELCVSEVSNRRTMQKEHTPQEEYISIDSNEEVSHLARTR